MVLWCSPQTRGPFVNIRFVFPNRIPIPPSAMVTGEMRVTDNLEVSEAPCNQLVPVSVQSWDSFDNLRCIHATFQHLNASGIAYPHLHSVAASWPPSAFLELIEFKTKNKMKKSYYIIVTRLFLDPTFSHIYVTNLLLQVFLRFFIF